MQSSDPVTSNPVNVEFVPVDIIADGRGMAGISGVDLEYGWVVTVGQNQLAEWESEQAHIRVVDWDQVMELQNLQSRDMEELIFGNSGTN
jgi:HlyD family secretion protein